MTGTTDNNLSHCFSLTVHPAVRTLQELIGPLQHTFIVEPSDLNSCVSFTLDDELILVYFSRHRLSFPAFNESIDFSLTVARPTLKAASFI